MEVEVEVEVVSGKAGVVLGDNAFGSVLLTLRTLVGVTVPVLVPPLPLTLPHALLLLLLQLLLLKPLLLLLLVLLLLSLPPLELLYVRVIPCLNKIDRGLNGSAVARRAVVDFLVLTESLSVCV